MVRRIIEIDENKCDGCGICVNACHEGAIGLIDGKARLLRDDYCDGLGDCLPACPTGAIAFIEREAAEYNEEAVKMNMEQKSHEHKEGEACGCLGSQPKAFVRENNSCCDSNIEIKQIKSQLSQWPVQIKLAPVNAPYFKGAKLLVAADCTAFAYGDFHNRFIKGRITLVGCPKLDNIDYSEKLAEIIKNNDIQSVTIVRMEVPCCGGLENAVKRALQMSGKFIPWQVVVISTDGRIISE